MLLLVLCLTQPLFDGSGPVCTPAAQLEACRCSECMTWDATPGATRYEVVRETMSNGAVYIVGTVYARLSDEGTLEVPTSWCVAKDSPFPREGTTYRYQVRGCNSLGCGGLSNGVKYTGAPYACFTGGKEVQCYVGDPLATR